MVGSPTSIVDARTPAEWPAGAKPVTRNVQYDDLYRVKQVSYVYAGGADTFVSPFAPERAGSSDPRQSSNFPTHLLPAQRVTQQTYQYDWLGSLVSADDDQHAMWDRGVGPMTNYASTGMPYRWKNAGDLAVPTWPGSGTAEALSYDEAGNLLDLQTTKVGTCTNGAGSCAVRFTYAYDEVGRLNKGVRIEGGLTKADLRFTYDHSDSRVLKADYSAGTTYYTVYLFGSLELRRATYNTSTGDYLQNATTETPFLSVGGEGLGRIVYQASAYGEPRIAASSLHVLLNIGDHLGSASIVVDKTTGELAERRTYLAYGATESDYRPARWKGFREDYGFTGKEEDIEIGLQYFGKRYLSPYLGRWVSADPLAVHAPGEADLNLYAYVHGAVLKSVDPLGLEAKDNTGGTATEAEQVEDIAPAPATGANGVASASAAVPATAIKAEVANWVEMDRVDRPAPWNPNSGGAPGQEPPKPVDAFVYGSYSKSIAPGLEREHIAIAGLHEDHGPYLASVQATGVKIGGESNYVEALVGVESVLPLTSEDICHEPIVLIGGGAGPEVPDGGGFGVTVGGYQTPADSGGGVYIGLQGGGLGEHVSVGVGWSTESSPDRSAGPDKGTEGNRTY